MKLALSVNDICRLANANAPGRVHHATFKPSPANDPDAELLTLSFTFSLNDICRMAMAKYAPGLGYQATLKTPPEGLHDPDGEILILEVVPRGTPPATSGSVTR